MLLVDVIIHKATGAVDDNRLAEQNYNDRTPHRIYRTKKGATGNDNIPVLGQEERQNERRQEN